ncbi:MAG: hypothetical protein H6Q90_4821 [Deltaproteobacteria bacterium]|nr:hypothetical protein [Deltaproteobacteria bacterium]
MSNQLVRVLPALAVVLAAPLARAQPTCTVAVVHAPEAVTAEIEAWMRAEPPCRVALQVRAVATADGLYVIAQEPSGRLHERVVPDGRTAAVLVASWAADDGAAAPAVATSATPGTSAPGTSAPGTTAVVATRPVERRSRLVDIGGMYSLTQDGTSLRIGIDALAVGPIRLGAVIARQTTTWHTTDPALQTTDLQLLARGATEYAWGEVSLRGELAAGFVRSSESMASSPSVTGPLAQASLTVGGWFTRNWRLRGGPLVETMLDASYPSGNVRGGLELRLWVGLDRRL